MNGYARVAAAIAIVALVGFAGLTFFRQGSGVGGVAPSPTTAPCASTPPVAQAPSPVPIDTSSWVPYTSIRYGFIICHPADWTETRSEHDWALPADADWLTTAAEAFKAPGATIRVTAWSVSVPSGTTIDSWLQTYCPLNTTPCSGLGPLTEPITMDGYPGSLVQFKDDTQAFVLFDDRMYVVAVWEPDADPRAAPYGGAQQLLKDYLATVRLVPGGPAPTSSSPAPS